ncbi:MAG: hypothetical protein K2P90_04945, partial [Holosporales bacterium]|nr:hypothetical protein [Holosporales bacterium]
WADELRIPDELSIPEKVETSTKEVAMALKLIDQLTTHFKPENYHDAYTEELKTIIQQKAKGLKPKAKGKAPKETGSKDIMKLLKASLENHQRKAA